MGPVLKLKAMDASRSIHLTGVILITCAVIGLAPLGAGQAATPPPIADDQPLTDRQKIIHVLNRLGYGPRPGDVERVEKMGLDRYIEQQLHPERIDDSELESDLAKFDILTMDATDLYQAFRDEQQAQKERQREQAEAAKASPDRIGASATQTNMASVGV